MRKHVLVRPVNQGDIQKFTEWSAGTKNNLYDPFVATYPTTFTLCAYDDQGPLVYVPVQQPFMLESLAIRPGASPIEVAVALRELIHTVITQSYLKGVGEIYFLCEDASTEAFAQNQTALKCEKVPYNLYRIKIRDLEKH